MKRGGKSIESGGSVCFGFPDCEEIVEMHFREWGGSGDGDVVLLLGMVRGAIRGGFVFTMFGLIWLNQIK